MAVLTTMLKLLVLLLCVVGVISSLIRMPILECPIDRKYDHTMRKCVAINEPVNNDYYDIFL